jgi:ABC-type glycerol-3-phosphate transport system substrate-binding protein
MKKAKMLTVIFTVFMVISLITACSSNSGTSQNAANAPESNGKGSSNAPAPQTDGKKVELRFGTNDVEGTPEHPIVMDILTKFGEENNAIVKFEGAPNYDFQTKIQLDATSDNLPDVFAYWRPDPSYGMPELIKARLMADLTEFTSDPSIKEMFGDYEWRTATVDDRTYGFPMSNFYIFTLANKTILEVFCQYRL